LEIALPREGSGAKPKKPLAFDQTARRWIGGILTLLLLGLPLLLAFGGRSLSDLLSGSESAGD
jgi:hypothetical protein